MTAPARAAEQARERWSSRPGAAFAIRAAAVLTPIAASIVFVAVVSRIVARPSGWLPTVLWFVLLTGASTCVLIAVERGMRRFLPLAALFRMSLVFPDQAPSRYKSAMRTRTLRQLQRSLDEGQVPDTAVGAQESAERLLALAMALNDHDRLTRGHTERVRAYTLMIGEEMGLPEADLDRLHWAGLVHDIGKLEVPPELLNKPGRPTDEEWNIIRQHPDAGLRLVEPLRPWLGEWADAASQHHERWDGKGYPFGLAGEETSLSGRIVAVADAYDVMTSVRSYKTAMTPADARAELARCAGTQFDPEVVRAFLNISLGKLRLVMGPLSWVAELPFLGRVPVGAAAGTAASSLAAMTFAVIAGLTGHAPHPETPLRAETAGVTIVSDPPRTTPARPEPRPTVPDPTTTTTTTAPTTTTTTSPEVDGPTTVTEPPVTTVPEEPPTTEPPPDTPPEVPAVVHLDAATSEDAPLVIDLTQGRSASPSASVAEDATHGVISLDGTTATYAPEADWSGTDAFAVDLDGAAHQTVEVTVTVAAVNDPPVADDAAVTVDEDGTVTVDLAGLTSDVEGDGLTVAALGSPILGHVDATGLQVTYTPNPDLSGGDDFTYEVSDGHGGTASGTVTVTVDPVEDAPVGGSMSASTAEDTDVAVDVAGAATDPDGDSLNITDLSALQGDVTVNGPLALDYSPPADFHGSDTITVEVADPDGQTATITVTVTVTSVNDTPTAGDDTASTNEDASVVVPLTGLVDDVDGDSLVLQSLGTPTQGSVSATGLDVTYVPDADVNGSDTFTYTVADPDGATATGTITVSVLAVQDAPVAQDDAFVADPILPLSGPAGSLLANDFDVDGDSISIVPGLTVQGVGLVVVGADGSFTYTAPLLFSGTDSFTYTVTDGVRTDTAVVTITVDAGATSNVSYLTPTPSAAGWTLATSAPPVGEPEPDTSDNDTKPGTTLKHTHEGLGENSSDKFRVWSRTFASATDLNGPVTLDLWSMVHDGEAKKSHLYAWLFDCSGSSCTQILASDLFADPWNARDTWTEHSLVLGSVNRTIAAGHDLRLRLQFDNEDMFVAQSGNRPSSLTFTTG